jgi:precorrin-2 dehydrogenase/sirohydrochlorin ferrochelatase
MNGAPRFSPVFLQPGDRLIVVFGGGKVAYRKCCNFEGFRIKAVASEIIGEIADLADEVVTCAIDEAVVRREIQGAFIAVAATSDKGVNAMICETAKEMGIPVNSAHGGGDVLIPSVLRKRNYTVAVSSEGKVPAFPPYVVEQLDVFLDESYDAMMDLLISIRPEVMGRIDNQPARAEYLADVVRDGEIWQMIEIGDTEGAREYALKKGGLQ